MLLENDILIINIFMHTLNKTSTNFLHATSIKNIIWHPRFLFMHHENDFIHEEYICMLSCGVRYICSTCCIILFFYKLWICIAYTYILKVFPSMVPQTVDYILSLRLDSMLCLGVCYLVV